MKCVEHLLSVERVYILVKGDRGRDNHEPVVIDLALGSDCSSDTDTASETEGM